MTALRRWFPGLLLVALVATLLCMSGLGALPAHAADSPLPSATAVHGPGHHGPEASAATPDGTSEHGGCVADQVCTSDVVPPGAPCDAPPSADVVTRGECTAPQGPVVTTVRSTARSLHALGISRT